MISEDQKKLLMEVSSSASKSVNSKRFRATHSELRGQIDELVERGFLARDINNNTEHYFLSLLALSEMNDAESTVLLEKMGLIFPFLKECYIHDPDASIKYSDVSSKFKFTDEETHEVMKLMHDLDVFSSWTSHPMYIYTASFTLKESILDYDTFQAAFDQLIDRAKERDNIRFQSLSKNALFDSPSSHGLPYVGVQLTKWPSCAPDNIQPILNEVSKAFSTGLLALTVMGLRTVIDMIGYEVAGDVDFKSKVAGLVDKDYLTETNKGTLNSALEVGHAAQHRAHIPSADDSQRVIDIVYHLLVSVYGSSHKEMLEKTTPKREKKK